MNDKLNYLNQNGVDTSIGLSYLGDESLYNEILKDFKDKFVEQMSEIRKDFESKNIEDYVIKVHALKSNCKTLGIMGLADLAYNHEMKGKEKDINYINNNITELFNKANEIYAVLNNYFNM